MSINWYPGHMYKARKEILKTLHNIDLLIEIVDARLPHSSQNPVIADLRHNKPTIIVLNKCDLADTKVTQEWQQYYENHDHIKTLACSQKSPQHTLQILSLCRKLVPYQDDKVEPINAMIVGIPNVGKSTIINTLAGRIIAKVGNEPAVTKQQQKINLDNGIRLHDTPGILWPKIENPNSGYRLAISGAIKNTAMEYEDVGFYAAEYFIENYPHLLKERYQLETIPDNALEFLEAMGAKRGAKQPGGRINLHKACEVLLHEYRNGTIGLMSLEQPNMIESEIQEVERIKEEKEHTQKTRKKNKRNKR